MTLTENGLTPNPVAPCDPERKWAYPKSAHPLRLPERKS
nr:hypothetical protein [Aeromonas veronii]